jgi:hypothetical protein
MPRAKETLRTQYHEQTEGEMRLITITVTGPVSEFLLTDVLRQRGAIPGPEAVLKQAVREALQQYLDGTEEMIASLASGVGKGSNGAKPKGPNGAESRHPEAPRAAVSEAPTDGAESVTDRLA